MADYPDWVLKHKKKGTYVNHANGKYYLYAAHSERIAGTKKVRRVSDGYIGRITEEGGLIPARDKVSGDIVVYEYGLHMTALAVADGILKGLRREFRAAAERVLVAGILLATGGVADAQAFRMSYLSVEYANMDFEKDLTAKQRVGAERCARMVNDKLSVAFGGDGRMPALLAHVHAVVVNGRQYLSKTPPQAECWLNEHGIEWGARHEGR